MTKPRVVRTLTAAVLAAATVAPAQARPSPLSVFPGTVTVVDGAPIPQGSTLRVTLHDLSPGVPKDAMVANATWDVAGKTPIPFQLPYNPSLIEPSRLYGIAAAITDARGRALWETRVPIRVLTMGNQKKVDLVVRPVERTEPPPEPTSLAIECEGLHFHVDLSPASATVVLQDSTVVLPATQVPFGKRYSDGTTTFAVSGSAAYFQWSGRAYRDCKARPEPETPPKP